MIEEYRKHEQERAAQNIPPLPLTADQTSDLVELLKEDHSESDFLMELLTQRLSLIHISEPTRRS